MQKVAIYVRVSTAEQAQEGYSIPAQISLLKKYAENYNYVTYKIYEDAGISGKNIKDRPGLLQLLEDVMQRKFDVVLIWKLSRLSRSLLDLLSVVDVLKQYNVSLLSYSEHFDTATPVGKMLLQLLGSIAEFERNTIIENVKMGMSERFKQGLSKSSIPFGYEYDDKNIILNEAKAKAVREIFQRYAAGASVQNLVDYLNSLGYRNRIGRSWRHEVVLKMLQNEFYMGYVTTGRKDLKRSNFEIQKGIHPPIIDEELFAAVQKKINGTKKAIRVHRVESDQLFSGIVACPHCGKGMYYVETVNYKNGKKYIAPIYRCGASHINRQQCKGFSISKNKIDPFVLSRLTEIITTEVLEHIPMSVKSLNGSDYLWEKLQALEHELQETLKARDRYFTLFETGKVATDAFSDRISELLKKITILQKEKEAIEKELNAERVDLSGAVEGLRSFMSIFKDLTPQERRDVMQTLIAQVRITTDKEICEIELIGGFVL